jgi:hypothetical protein
MRRTVVSSGSSIPATTPSHNSSLEYTVPMSVSIEASGPVQTGLKANQVAVGTSAPCSARKGLKDSPWGE